MNSETAYRFERVLALLEERTAVREGDAWADLGCHTGTFLRMVIARYGVDPAGVDVYPPHRPPDPWAYFQRDLPVFDLPRQYRFISALELIEHVIDTDAFLKGCRDLLEPGGFLILSTPNINSLRNRVMTFFGVYPANLEYKNVIHHVRLYNARKLEEHLAEHGFETLSVRGVSFLPLRFDHANRTVGRLSARLADRFPRLCGNLIVIARKKT
ncbi:MAG: hypothetical protein A3D28_04475 [Omnitrophica bacterium RIFCSPHIGHO2_02_FULL_63_14]|nr:MAG: hypothetical protein A3D28_04475 [Omnitrophica bacterium RIFCSPHIGHO2_02_FULL_63_14]